MKASLYHEITGQFINEPVAPTELDATIAQQELSWKQHPITAKFHKETRAEINVLIDAAISQACSYHVDNNHLQVIEKLIRANELTKLLEKYS